MHPALSWVTERLPNLREKVTRFFDQSEDFRELCEEYQACCEALARLASPGSNEALRREYLALRLRLEGEILRYVAEHPEA
jgi:hypothetical protein